MSDLIDTVAEAIFETQGETTWPIARRDRCEAAARAAVVACLNALADEAKCHVRLYGDSAKNGYILTDSVDRPKFDSLHEYLRERAKEVAGG